MRNFLLLFVFPALYALAHTHAETPAPYQLITEIPIGGEGGWDILNIDAAARRLYLSHATKVVVVDLEKNAIVGEITDTPGVHAFVPVPELQRGFSSNGKENKSSVVDLKTLKTISKIETGENPDAIAMTRSEAKFTFSITPANPPLLSMRRRRKSWRPFRSAASPEFAAVDVSGRSRLR